MPIIAILIPATDYVHLLHQLVIGPVTAHLMRWFLNHTLYYTHYIKCFANWEYSSVPAGIRTGFAGSASRFSTHKAKQAGYDSPLNTSDYLRIYIGNKLSKTHLDNYERMLRRIRIRRQIPGDSKLFNFDIVVIVITVDVGVGRTSVSIIISSLRLGGKKFKNLEILDNN